MALTVIQIRKAKPGAGIQKLSDGGGLQIWVFVDGAKRWRMAYRFNGQQKTLAVGVYPAVGLKEAREAREAAKHLLTSGQDPVLARKIAKATKASAAANTFDAVAAELFSQEAARGQGGPDPRQNRMAFEPRQPVESAGRHAARRRGGGAAGLSGFGQSASASILWRATIPDPIMNRRNVAKASTAVR